MKSNDNKICQFVHIISEKKPVVLRLDDVLWIESQPDIHGIFVTTRRKKDAHRVYNDSLATVLLNNPFPNLQRISSHTIINLTHVCEVIGRNTFVIPTLFEPMKNDVQKFHLGKTYLKQADDFFQAWETAQHLARQ